MTTFITGGAGFIGSNFAHYVYDLFEDLVIIDKFTYASNIKNLFPLEIPIKKVDLANKLELELLFKEFKPKYIFHFAAETHVDNSIKDFYPFIESNIIGTINLLDLSLNYDVQMFHHISTDEVYGSLSIEDPPFDENSPYNPQNPYSASKASSDHFVISFFNTYGLPVKITNCSNNYGPRQNKEKLIPKVINNILEGKKIPIYGKGENIRDWIYVEDHCRGILEVWEKGIVGGKYNIGGNCEIKNINLVKLIISLMDAKEDLIEFVEDRAGHDFRYAINNKKVIDELNFKPLLDINDGLLKTINWYMERKKY